jgi:hypothetical protein
VPFFWNKVTALKPIGTTFPATGATTIAATRKRRALMDSVGVRIWFSGDVVEWAGTAIRGGFSR